MALLKESEEPISPANSVQVKGVRHSSLCIGLCTTVLSDATSQGRNQQPCGAEGVQQTAPLSLRSLKPKPRVVGSVVHSKPAIPAKSPALVFNNPQTVSL